MVYILDTGENDPCPSKVEFPIGRGKGKKETKGPSSFKRRKKKKIGVKTSLSRKKKEK